LDNYGVSRHPGQRYEPGEFNWVWGCDEAAIRAVWVAADTK
jgi:hypothetical protein